jgi:S-adenosylmethionine:tRNA ribosyltransferase-isomerase
MIAAATPVQRPRDARLLSIDAEGGVHHSPRRMLVDLLRRGDLLVANDAATLPASLTGRHLRTDRPVELRLAAWHSRAGEDITHVTAVLFGDGDYRTRTENRPLPPLLAPGDRLALGPLSATIVELLDHPRLVSIVFDGSPEAVWAGIARHGRAVQYAHLTVPLALWDVWTPFAARPAAFEPPSAGFALDWHILAELRERGILFATITHAAGLSSTGDAELDMRLPLDEPYEIPDAAADAIACTRRQGGRVIAVGTTVVRALEHAALRDGIVRAGWGTANQRITAGTRLRVVDAILSGTHEPGTSHYELLRAFVPDEMLKAADEELNERGYRTHEFGDSVFIERRETSYLRTLRGTPLRTCVGNVHNQYI